MGFTVQDLQARVTTTEWLGWLQFMRQEPEIKHRENRMYLAKIVWLLRAAVHDKSDLADNYLKISWDDGETPPPDPKALAQTSRDTWFGLLGMPDPITNLGDHGHGGGERTTTTTGTPFWRRRRVQ